MPPAVSILLPVRNAAATLAEALDSLLAQTFRDFEAIAIDDGSTDDSAAMLGAFAARDPRIHPLPNAQAPGLVGALRTAHAAARAPLLARMDADDLAHPQRLERQVAFLHAHPDLAGCGTRVRIVGAAGPGWRRYEKWTNALTTPEVIARERFVESPLVHPTVLLRRGPFEAVGGYLDPPWAEDYDLWLRLLDAGHRLAKVPEALLDWRDAPGRLTRTDPHYGEQAFLAAKAHYLAKIAEVRRRGVMISGAGPTGKRLARLLNREGVRVAAFIDVHPGRIGTRLVGVPVLAVQALPAADQRDAPFQLAAVGQVGRREIVRRLLVERGWREGEDFFCTA